MKAKAQIEVYKEIYDLEEGEEGLELAKNDDEGILKEYFKDDPTQKVDDELSDKQLKQELQKLQLEIESLEEVKSGHQGFKFLRTATTKDMFEDAMIELREKHFDKKFLDEKEKLTGKGPKTI